MLREIKTSQRGVRFIFCKLNASGSSLSAGGEQVTVVKNATGDFTFTLKNPGVRNCMAIVTPTEDDTQFYVSATTNSTVQVKTETVAGAAADKDYYLCIVAFDSADAT